MVKRCPKCKEHKPLSEFYKCSTKKDGLLSYCKICTKITGKEGRDRNRKRYNKWASKYQKRYRMFKDEFGVKTLKQLKEIDNVTSN